MKNDLLATSKKQLKSLKEDWLIQRNFYLQVRLLIPLLDLPCLKHLPLPVDFRGGRHSLRAIRRCLQAFWLQVESLTHSFFLSENSWRGDIGYPEHLTFIGKLLIEWWSIVKRFYSANWFSVRIYCRVAINTQSPIARSLRLLFPAILLAIMVNIPKYFETRTAVVSKLHGASR